MGKNLQKQYPFRTDEIFIKKLDYIAKYNSRNRNDQIEFLIKECIRNFEKEIGTIDITHTEK